MEHEKVHSPVLVVERQERILACLDKGLSCLGDRAKDIVYWHLATTKGIQPKDILRRPQDFVKSLEEMFGVGRRVLEERIKKEILGEFPITSEPGTLVDVLVTISN
jgi:hypothetical protein